MKLLLVSLIFLSGCGYQQADWYSKENCFKAGGTSFAHEGHLNSYSMCIYTNPAMEEK